MIKNLFLNLIIESLRSYVQVEEVFKQITDTDSAVDYSEPIEWYIKRYKLNGYEIEADEV